LQKISYFYSLYLTHEVRKRENFNDFWRNNENIQYFLNLVTSIAPLRDKSNMEIIIPQNKTYIKILRPDIETKIIVFGDIHGSFHTFLRLIFRLHRLGALNLDTFKVSNNFKIVFLGDVVDRGNFSLEILLIILSLLKENPDDVFFNRGNHEEIEINRANGLKDEIKKKMNSNHSDIVFDAINIFLLKCSSGIFIKHDENNKLFLSHGGFSKHSIKAYKNLNFTQDDYIFINDYQFNEELMLKDYTGTFTRWSDFTNDITCMNRGFQTDSCIEKRDLQKFVKLNKIDFLIRGHQDSLSNNYLFSNKISYTNNYTCAGTILSENKDRLGEAVIYNKINNDYSADGCICRVIANKFDGGTFKVNKKLELYSVLTTSTNTDINRMLCRDSFVVVRFNITDINDFTTSLGNNPDLLHKFPIGIKL